MVTATDERPRSLRVLNGVGRVAARFGLEPSLDPSDLVAAAERSTGLDDFGDPGHREGLERLCASLEDEADLTLLGRIAARTRIVRLLETRLRLLEHRRLHPEVADEPIARPIFVLGLPRTGTTVLYGLLAADPAQRSPVSWEVANPFPPPRRGDHEHDPRVRRTEKEFDQFRRIAPNIDAIHPLGAMLPQECMSLQAPSFVSYEFATAFPVPGYQSWLFAQDPRPAYEFQRLFLQHLQSGYAGERWILKTPAHLLWLRAPLDVFDDALVIQTHRDPTTVLASVSSLMYAMRSAVSDSVDPHDVGRDQLEVWSGALEETMRVRDTLPADRVVDVHFRDTLADPVGTVRRIHEHFDMPFTAATESGVRSYLDENPRTKHGVHRYTLDTFGIDRDEADRRFAGYRERFDVAD